MQSINGSALPKFKWIAIKYSVCHQSGVALSSTIFHDGVGTFMPSIVSGRLSVVFRFTCYWPERKDGKYILGDKYT